MSTPFDELLAASGSDVPAGGVADSFLGVVVRTQGLRPHALADALESLAAQTDDDFETLIVVHSSEVDVSERVASGLADSGRDLPSNRRILTTEGGGRSRPLNTGISATRARYVAFLDDDDLALADWVATFRAGSEKQPGAMVRAACLSQRWEADENGQPTDPAGERTQEFAPEFDLLAHFHHNETPICSIALPVAGIRRHELRFAEDLPVLEDWDLIMRAAMLLGVVSMPQPTSVYRRLDSGDSAAAASELIWHRTHGAIVERLDSHPVLLPAGAARRLTLAHFLPDGSTKHQRDLDESSRESWETDETQRLRSLLRIAELQMVEETERLTDHADGGWAQVRALEASPWWRVSALPRRVVSALKERRHRSPDR